MAKKAGGKSKTSKAAGADCAMPMPYGPDRREVAFRKITNGYLVTESGVRRGAYFSRETFTTSPPKVLITPPTKRD